MKLLRLGIFLATLTPALVRAGGDEVVVIYNSRMPESKAIAEHYAAARLVPERQVFSFALTTNEVMTRADFTGQLQKPLAEKLESAGLWKFAPVSFPATNGQPARTEKRVVESKIRYAVLCYGVPLKIAPSSIVEAIAEKITRTEFRRNEAAVDSELAWLPLVNLEVPLTGPIPNPFYAITNQTALHPANGILLVARLDGPTPEIAGALVDKAREAERNGLWGRAYIDARGLPPNDNFAPGDQWMLASALIARQLGYDCEADTSEATLPDDFPMSHIAIYAGWYVGEASGPFKQPKMEFMPGAIAYHLYSFSAESLHTTADYWCRALLARGATCTMGCVYEPYLQFTPNIAFLLQAMGNNYTFGEAAWAAQPALSWHTTVIGDPLYQPFKKSPPELHAWLAKNQNPLIEWSFNRLVALDQVHGVRTAELVKFLEGVPATEQSAVLKEKLAELYTALGKPSTAIAMWQQALKLKPSPQQRIRLRRILADKLAAQDRLAEAAENWRQLLAEAPDYPGRTAIAEKLKALEQKIAGAPKP